MTEALLLTNGGASFEAPPFCILPRMWQDSVIEFPVGCAATEASRVSASHRHTAQRPIGLGATYAQRRAVS